MKSTQTILAAVIFAGLIIVLGTKQKDAKIGISSSKGSTFDISEFMSGNTTKYEFENLSYGNTDVVMGGANIDLTQCKLQPNAKIEAFAMMGSVKITVPKDWKIEMHNDALMGGSSVAKSDSINPDKVLAIYSSTIMGRIDVRRK